MLQCLKYYYTGTTCLFAGTVFLATVESVINYNTVSIVSVPMIHELPGIMQSCIHTNNSSGKKSAGKSVGKSATVSTIVVFL